MIGIKFLRHEDGDGHVQKVEVLVIHNILCSWLNMTVRLYFIMSQQSRKNETVKPFGPGALSPSIERMVSFISSCKKGDSREEGSSFWYSKEAQLKVAALFTEVPTILVVLSTSTHTGTSYVCTTRSYAMNDSYFFSTIVKFLIFYK